MNRAGWFVAVDRQAIYENDQDGGDRPAIALYDAAGGVTTHRELAVGRDGAHVGTFRSQSRGRPIDPARPHVWFEFAP